ncbi:hypothetical protein [Kriegella aquimaris]|uniref:Hpt domain-containing protein n=1 Tax=Kriegella aquimaris TaxID=192904 RepID=A0A1G9KDU7_9FLAO|nr:hypothetical protein [Kriegella aquimaris]SDL47988.1 Hpt domain-containing protein [Kriegella aquimaris]
MNETPNLDYITNISKGDILFVKKILGIVARELPTEIASYKLHLKEKEYQKSADGVHKLKHKIRIFGLEKSYLLAADHEQNLREENLSLEADFEQILETILLFTNQKNQEI